MNLSPCFHQPALALGKIAADELDGIDREDADVILVVRMEVRSMVGRCWLGEHTDDDSKEPGRSLASQLAFIGGGAEPRDDQCPLAPLPFA